MKFVCVWFTFIFMTKNDSFSLWKLFFFLTYKYKQSDRLQSRIFFVKLVGISGCWFRGSCCRAPPWSPWWTPASPAAPLAACRSAGPPRGWPSPRSRSPSPPGWWWATAQRRACHSGARWWPRARCSCLQDGGVETKRRLNEFEPCLIHTTKIYYCPTSVWHVRY